MMPPASRIAGREFFRDRPFVKSARALFGDRRKRRRQIGLNQPCRLRAAKCRRRGKISLPTTASAPAAGAISARCRPCRRSMTMPSRARSIAGFSNSRQREFARAVFFQRQRQSRDACRARRCRARSRATLRYRACRRRRGKYRAWSQPARSRDSRSRCPRRDRRVDHHEAAAADISRARIGHGHGKAGRHRRIDRIAAAPQHVGADARRDLLLRHHHAVLGDDRMNGARRRRHVDAAARVLRGGRQAKATASTMAANIQRRSDLNKLIRFPPRERANTRGGHADECYMGSTAEGKTPPRDRMR